VVIDYIGDVDCLCFAQGSCYFQRTVLWSEVVDTGLLFPGTGCPVFVDSPHSLPLFLLFVHSLRPGVIVPHLQLHALAGLGGIA